jgi:predicted MFS family arabinose efflux permease
MALTLINNAAGSKEATPHAGAARVGWILFWALASFGANLGLARFSYGVLLPALMHQFPAPYSVFGTVNAFNLGGYLVGTLIAPFFARGTKLQIRAYLSATIVVALTLAASAMSRSIVALAVTHTLTGTASAVGIAMTAVLTFERVAPSHRARASSAMWAGAAVGIFLTAPSAPLTVGAPPILTWRVLWLIMAALTLVVAFGFAAVVRGRTPLPAAGTHDAHATFDWHDMLRPHRFLHLGLSYLFFGIAYIAYATFAVALFRSHGIPAAQAGLAWALVGVGGVAGALTVGYLLASRLGRTSLIIAATVGVVGSGLALGSSLASIVLSALLYGFGCVATPAVITAFSRARSSAAAYPGTYSAITALLCVGQFSGPLLAGPFVDRYGLDAAAAFTAAAFVLGVVTATLDASANPPNIP